MSYWRGKYPHPKSLPEASGRDFFKRIFHLFGAMGFFALGLSLLVWAGLPNPADYVGYEIPNVWRVAPQIGAFAPPFQALTLDGQVLDSASLQGETFILNFWATWCVPCALEMPELQSLYEATGVRILAVNLGESEAAINTWVEEYGLNFEILLDSDFTIANAYQLRGQPSTYIIAPSGIISQIFYGATTAHRLETALNALKER